MPRIPIYESEVPLLQTGPNYMMGAVQEAARGPAMIGDALGGLAKGVANTADMLQDYADKDEVRKAAADLSSFQIDQAQRTADRQKDTDPASSTYVDDSLNDYDSRARSLINKFAHNRKAQEYLDQRLSGHRTEIGTAAIGTHAAAMAKAQRTQAAATITNLTKQVSADPARLDAAFQELDTVIDTLPGGQAEREAARFGARRLFAQSYWKGLIERDPGASLQQLKTGKFIGNEYFNDADRAGLILQANDGLKRRELETSRTRYAQQAAAQQQKIKDATSGEFPPIYFKTALDTDFAGDALKQDFAKLMRNSAAQRQARAFDEVKTNIQSGIFTRADIDAQIARGDWPKTLAPELTQLADQVWARRQDDTAADIRFQDILKNRTPFDPADRALGPAIQRYVTGEFQPSVLPDLTSADPAAQTTGFAKVAAFYTEMTPFQRAQVRFDAIPTIEPSNAASDIPTPATTPADAAATEPALPDTTTVTTPPPPAPQRTAFTLEKILPKPVAYAMAGALEALDPAAKAQQLCTLYKDVGPESWSKFCTELRATGRISDTTTTMAVAATQPDAEHTTPGLALAVTALSTHGTTTSSAGVDPATLKAVKDQARQHILWVADKVGLGSFAASLAQTGATMAAAEVAKGDSADTAINNVTIMLFGNAPVEKAGATQSRHPETANHDELWAGVQLPERGDHTNAVDPKAFAKRVEEDDPARAAKANEIITRHYGRFLPPGQAEKLSARMQQAVRDAQFAKDHDLEPEEIRRIEESFAHDIGQLLSPHASIHGSLNKVLQDAFHFAITGKGDTASAFYLHALPGELATELTGVDPKKGDPKDREVSPEDRLRKWVEGSIAPNDVHPPGIVDVPYLPPDVPRSSTTEIVRLTDDVKRIRSMSADEYERYERAWGNTAKSAEFEDVKALLREVRDGKRGFFLVREELRKKFVATSFFNEVFDIGLDLIPFVSQVRLGIDAAEHVDGLLDAIEADDYAAVKYIGSALATIVVGAALPAGGRAVKRFAKSDLVQALTQKIVDARQDIKKAGARSWQDVTRVLGEREEQLSKATKNKADDVLRALHLRGGDPDQYIVQYRALNPRQVDQPPPLKWDKPWTRDSSELNDISRTEIKKPAYIDVIEMSGKKANDDAISWMREKGYKNPLPPYREDAQAFVGKIRAGEVYIQLVQGPHHYSKWLMTLDDFERIMKLPNATNALADIYGLERKPIFYRAVRLEKEMPARVGTARAMPEWQRFGGGLQIELLEKLPERNYSNVKEISKYGVRNP